MSHSKKPELENIEYYQTIALNIAYFRRLAGYTQSMLAKKAGISLPYLGTLESRNSLKPCSMEVLFDLARALDIEPYQLLMPLSDSHPTAPPSVQTIPHPANDFPCS